MNPDSHTNTIIIGAGAAGLAAAVCLKQVGVPFIVLEESDGIGTRWLQRYDRLHLHTPGKHSQLPYFKVPREFPRYISKDQYANYLKAYAAHFNIQPQFNHKVTAVQRRDENWEVTAGVDTFYGAHLVVATGYAQKPVMPSVKGMEKFKGVIMHSNEYTNGSAFKDKKVLVVGFGNSAGEIAICLHEHGAVPALSVRSAVNVVPRDIAGISIISMAIAQNWITKLSPAITDAINKPLLRLINGNLRKSGLQVLNYGAMTQIIRHQSVPLLDVGTIDLIKKGKVKVFPGIHAMTEEGVIFSNGKTETFDAIIFATGYQPAYKEFFSGRNRESDLSSVHFCGFKITTTGMLREIGIEAKGIAKAIASAGV
jgi:indole-3-pyruvate monooxygenase